MQDLQGNPGGCESVPSIYDDSSVITYVCQAQSPSRYSVHQQAQTVRAEYKALRVNQGQMAHIMVCSDQLQQIAQLVPVLQSLYSVDNIAGDPQQHHHVWLACVATCDYHCM